MKKIYNFKKYINDLETKKIDNYKISIIYTFISIANIIEWINTDMAFMMSEIGKENQLKTIIDEFKSRNIYIEPNNHNIIIHFEQFNSNKINL